MSLSPDRHARNAELFFARLKAALDVALAGNVAIVIVPPDYPKQFALNGLINHANKHADKRVCGDGMAMYVEGTRGSVRIYPATHITYDQKQQRLLDYPAGIPHFLHPEVEGI